MLRTKFEEIRPWGFESDIFSFPIRKGKSETFPYCQISTSALGSLKIVQKSPLFLLKPKTPHTHSCSTLPSPLLLSSAAAVVATDAVAGQSSAVSLRPPSLSPLGLCSFSHFFPLIRVWILSEISNMCRKVGRFNWMLHFISLNLNGYID